MSRSLLCPVFLMSLVLGCSWQSQAAPMPDRLERPSPISPLAMRSPLSAIQRLRDHQVMVGESGHILLRTADGQVTQARVPVDLLLTALYFFDDLHGWAVGHDGVILYSRDGGLSWKKQLDGNAINPLLQGWAEIERSRRQQAVDAQPADPASVAALDAAQFMLDDLKAGSASGPSRPLLDVWFRDRWQGWAVGAYGVILGTRDGGRTWAYVPGLDNPERLHLNSVLGLADGSLIVAGEGGHVYRSMDNGQHWQATQSLGQASLYKLLALGNGDLLAMGFKGALFVSHDSGGHWQALSAPAEVSFFAGQQLRDGTVLLVGQAGVVALSLDGEHFQTWRSPNKAALMGVAEAAPGQLTLVGGNGVQTLSLTELKEHLQ